MIQRHPIFKRASPWASGLLVCAILAVQQLSAADLGYPPPPGAYPSEPAERMEPIRPYAPAISPGAEDGGPNSTRSSSRLLPLPEDTFGAKQGRYDANTLFGSSPALQSGQPDALEWRDAGPAAHAYGEHGESAKPGHPSYAPAYPAHQQQYQSPRHPGTTTGYVDRYPGYPQTGAAMPPASHYPAAAPNADGHSPEGSHAPGDGYAQGGRIDGGAIPETPPGAPLSGPPPNPGDSSVFRPPD